MRSLSFFLYGAAAQILSVSGSIAAQADQSITMVCKSSFPGQSKITIDFDAKTITDEYTILSVPVSVTHGTLMRVSDTEITFYIESDGYLRQDTLNRYSGLLVSKPLNALSAAAVRLAPSVKEASCRSE